MSLQGAFWMLLRKLGDYVGLDSSRNSGTCHEFHRRKPLIRSWPSSIAGWAQAAERLECACNVNALRSTDCKRMQRPIRTEGNRVTNALLNTFRSCRGSSRGPNRSAPVSARRISVIGPAGQVSSASTCRTNRRWQQIAHCQTDLDRPVRPSSGLFQVQAS